MPTSGEEYGLEGAKNRMGEAALLLEGVLQAVGKAEHKSASYWNTNIAHRDQLHVLMKATKDTLTKTHLMKDAISEVLNSDYQRYTLRKAEDLAGLSLRGFNTHFYKSSFDGFVQQWAYIAQELMGFSCHVRYVVRGKAIDYNPMLE
eukprot:m.66134 g.66134  ORF g.66134 m.66134 type:complete len:147 (+) comp13715_c0_seq1:574-1014(+)